MPSTSLVIFTLNVTVLPSGTVVLLGLIKYIGVLSTTTTLLLTAKTVPLTELARSCRLKGSSFSTKLSTTKVLEILPLPLVTVTVPDKVLLLKSAALTAPVVFQ